MILKKFKCENRHCRHTDDIFCMKVLKTKFETILIRNLFENNDQQRKTQNLIHTLVGRLQMYE